MLVECEIVVLASCCSFVSWVVEWCLKIEPTGLVVKWAIVRGCRPRVCSGLVYSFVFVRRFTTHKVV